MPHIVVIDDDSETLRMVSTMLQILHYQVTTWHTGARAVEHIACTKPDLVLLDNRLGYPVDGWGILQEIRINDETVRIPIILYSADHGFLQKKHVLIRGMGADVLYKPFTIEELAGKLAAMLPQGNRVD